MVSYGTIFLFNLMKEFLCYSNQSTGYLWLPGKLANHQVWKICSITQLVLKMAATKPLNWTKEISSLLEFEKFKLFVLKKTNIERNGVSTSNFANTTYFHLLYLLTQTHSLTHSHTPIKTKMTWFCYLLN